MKGNSSVVTVLTDNLFSVCFCVCVCVKTHLHSKKAKQGPERTLPVLLLRHAAECSHHETIDAVHHNIQVCSALKNK